MRRDSCLATTSNFMVLRCLSYIDTEGIKLDGVTAAKRVTGDLAENHFQTFGTLNRLT